MSSFKSVITLKQVTPMIHFQAKRYNNKNDNVLSLRPSEVKPKLDRFIRLWYQKNNKGKSLPKAWYTEYDAKKEKNAEKEGKEYSPDHLALNYKMRINPEESVEGIEPTDGAYFGNMGSNRKYQVFFEKNLELTIICMISDLKKLIDECIETFFLVTNFGSRQDKGYGCFIVKTGNTQDDTHYDSLLKEWEPNNTPIIKIQYPLPQEGYVYLSEINLVYKLLKSGVNMSGIYVRSALTDYFLYYNKVKIAGEKRAMKRAGVGPSVYDKYKDGKYYGQIVEEEQKDVPDKNERYIRGLFGYGQKQEWFYADKDHKKQEEKDEKGKLVLNKNGKPKMRKTTIKIQPGEENPLERIPSPLQFVVAGKSIYIIPLEIDERVYGKKFTFSSGFKPEYLDSKEKLELSIPSDKEFNINAFMEWFGSWLINEENRSKLKQSKAVFKEDTVTISVLNGGKRD